MNRKEYGEIKSPLKAIKFFCREECCSGNYTYVKECTDTKCPLYAFRLGKNTYLSKALTEEQRSQMAERLAAFRYKKPTV